MVRWQVCAVALSQVAMGCAATSPDGTPVVSDATTCTQYVECVAEADPSSTAAAAAAYGPGGTCFASTSAELCGDACAKAAAALFLLDSDATECLIDGLDADDLLRPVEGVWYSEGGTSSGFDPLAYQAMQVWAPGLVTLVVGDGPAFSLEFGGLLGVPDIQGYWDPDNEIYVQVDCRIEAGAFSCEPSNEGIVKTNGGVRLGRIRDLQIGFADNLTRMPFSMEFRWDEKPMPTPLNEDPKRTFAVAYAFEFDPALQ